MDPVESHLCIFPIEHAKDILQSESLRADIEVNEIAPGPTTGNGADLHAGDVAWGWQRTCVVLALIWTAAEAWRAVPSAEGSTVCRRSAEWRVAPAWRAWEARRRPARWAGRPAGCSDGWAASGSR